MFTFMYFFKLFLSSALSGWGLMHLTEDFEDGITIVGKISYYFFFALMIIAYVCTVISIFGMIWTF